MATDEPLVHTDEGDWRWQVSALGLEQAYPTPDAAAEAGVVAIREAVEAGRLSASEARDVAMDARFALGTHEHHLGEEDAGAFSRLSELEDELADASTDPT